MRLYELTQPSLSVRLTEGGSMPGVGAIHIDEIEPTLDYLENND